MNMIQNMKKSLIYAVLLVLALSSCYYDNVEQVYPNVIPCDTLNVVFNPKIQTILANNCLSCHSNSVASSAGNGIKLQDYADVKTNLDKIIGSVSHNSGYAAMPKNASIMDVCKIKSFVIWKKNNTPQ